MRSRTPEVALFGVVLVWGSTFVLTKQAFQEISPLAFAFVRFAGMSLLALAVLAASVRAGQAQWTVRRADLFRFLVVGVCGYTFYQLGFVLGLERTSPFSSALLIGTVPLFTIGMLTFMGERQPWRAWLGVSIALVGTVVFLLDKLGTPGSLVGDLLSLGSAVSFAAYGVLNRPLVRRYPTATYTTFAVLAGAIPLLAVSLPAAINQDWHAVSTTSWLVVIYMIVLPVYAAYIVWNWAIGRRGAAAASSFALLTPVVSGVLSALTFGEGFDTEKLSGAGLVLVGLIALRADRFGGRCPPTVSRARRTTGAP